MRYREYLTRASFPLWDSRQLLAKVCSIRAIRSHPLLLVNQTSWHTRPLWPSQKILDVFTTRSFSMGESDWEKHICYTLSVMSVKRLDSLSCTSLLKNLRTKSLTLFAFKRRKSSVPSTARSTSCL